MRPLYTDGLHHALPGAPQPAYPSSYTHPTAATQPLGPPQRPHFPPQQQPQQQPPPSQMQSYGGGVPPQQPYTGGPPQPYDPHHYPTQPSCTQATGPPSHLPPGMQPQYPSTQSSVTQSSHQQATSVATGYATGPTAAGPTVWAPTSAPRTLYGAAAPQQSSSFQNLTPYLPPGRSQPPTMTSGTAPDSTGGISGPMGSSGMGGMGGTMYPSSMTPTGVDGSSRDPSGPAVYPYHTMGPSAVPLLDPSTETRAEEARQNNPYPHFVMPSCSRLPNSASLNQKAHIPLGVVFRPLAPTPEGLADVPAVNFGPQGRVVRCSRCRTYINPFVEWEASGKRWVCNLCAYSNEAPQSYYASLDETGKRVDRFERAELSRSSVEFIAPDDYMLRPPQPPTFMFLIDVTAPAVASGLVDCACQAIKSILQSQRFPGGSRTQIGIMTYDSSVHFYNLDPLLSQAQMVVMPDLKDCFLPLPEGILVPAADVQHSLESLLENLSNMWRNQRTTESCMGSAINAAYVAMRHIGGKLSVFSSAVPSIGEMTLSSHREVSKDSASSGAEGREHELLQPCKEDYVTLATYMTQAQISVDLYVCPQGNLQMDLATLAPLATNTGGDLHYYGSFNAHLQGVKLKSELTHALTREQGWEALVRFRVSKGWNIATWHGHFQLRKPDLLVLPCAHCDSAFTIMLSMQENVVPDPIVYIQNALLYTNSEGERRIRVHTYALSITQHLNDLVVNLNIPVTSYVISLQAIEFAAAKNLTEARNYVNTICNQLKQSTQGDGRVALPADVQEATGRTLPLYLFSLLKSVALREAKDVSYDQRIYTWTRMTNLPVDSLLANIYPRMFPLHDLLPHHGTYDEAGKIILPDTIPLTAANMVEGGVYLLENGESLSLWISRNVNSEWLKTVTGVDSIEHLQPEYSESLIGSSGSDEGVRILSIVQALQKERLPTFMKLTIYRQGDTNEYKFFCSVVEDRNHALMKSFSEFNQRTVPRGALAAAPTSMHPSLAHYH